MIRARPVTHGRGAAPYGQRQRPRILAPRGHAAGARSTSLSQKLRAEKPSFLTSRVRTDGGTDTGGARANVQPESPSLSDTHLKRQRQPAAC